MTQKLAIDETELVGGVTEKQGLLLPDEVAERIDFLIKNVLKHVANSDDGWDTLYVDPDDGRFWELTYPASNTHGGGAARLKAMSKQQAHAKYNI